MSLNFNGIQDFITRRVKKMPSVRSLLTSDSGKDSGEGTGVEC